jgi:uncharacterized membrane protein YfcA
VIRSAFGFGEALVAVPLIAFWLPLPVAAPLAVLVSITIAGIVVIQDWKKIHVRSAGWLVVSSLFGIPLGLLLLTNSHQRGVKAVLAMMIIAFAVYSLIGRNAAGVRAGQSRLAAGVRILRRYPGRSLRNEWSTAGCLRRHAQMVRAAFPRNPARIFLPASLIGMGGYWLAGLWTSNVTRYYLLSLAVTFLGVYLGRVVNHRLQGKAFFKYLYLGLAGVGALLLVQAFTGHF